MQNFKPEQGENDEESYVETTVLSSTQQHTMTGDEDPTEQPQDTVDQADSPSMLHSPSLINSTPRATSTKAAKTRAIPQPVFAEFPSPYEALKQEHQDMLSTRPGIGMPQPPDSPTLTSKLPAISRITPGGQPPHRARPGGGGGDGARRGGDVLLHRVLDKTYRIQATPHKTPASQIPRRGVQSRPRAPAKSAVDSSPLSSPDVARPELNPDVFSPLTRRNATMTAGTSKKPRTPKPEYKQGVSVLQTPRQGYGGGDVGPLQSQPDDDEGEDDDDDDDWGEIEGMSPPKTIQFAVPPSRLLRTPGEFDPFLSFFTQIPHLGQHLLSTGNSHPTRFDMSGEYTIYTPSNPGDFWLTMMSKSMNENSKRSIQTDRLRSPNDSRRQLHHYDQ